MKSRSVCSLALGILALPIVAFGQSVPLVGDSYIIPGSAGNYGVQPLVSVGGPSAFNGLAQFDLSTLPAGITAANVSKATLILFARTVTAAGTINISAASGTAWNESSVTGLTGVSTGTSVASGISVSSANAFIYVDATNLVKSWITTPASNQGFIITPNDGVVYVSFDSKESTTTSHPAELAITLSSSGSAGPTGITGPTGVTGVPELPDQPGRTDRPGQPELLVPPARLPACSPPRSAAPIAMEPGFRESTTSWASSRESPAGLSRPGLSPRHTQVPQMASWASSQRFREARRPSRRRGQLIASSRAPKTRVLRMWSRWGTTFSRAPTESVIAAMRVPPTPLQGR